MSTEVQFNLYDFSEETLEFLYNLPTEFPPSDHTHVVADITDLPDLVDGTGSISVSSIETNGLTVQEDATINGTLNADDIQGNLTGNIYVSVQAGQNLLKGDPVYISGTYTSGAISLPIVSRADSSDPAKMPAAGIMDADLNTGINGNMVISGRIANFNTNNYNLNAELYVDSGGGFTTTAPTLLPQPIARVSRKDTNYGSIIVKVDGIAGVGPEGPPGDGVAGNNDVGVLYLKNNATATTIPSINGRAVVAGTMQTGLLFNFEKDATTNSLKYTGDGGRFHVVASFNFYSGSNDTCGFYIGKNTVPGSALDPDLNRISESEIYANAVSQTKPSAAAVQTVLDLNPGDRIFFIVQNKDSTSSIKVEFLKFVAVTLTSEKGDVGPEGPPAPYVDPVRTTLTGDGSTSVYAISGAGSLVNPSALIVAIDGALQEPGADYGVSGGNIIFTSPLESGAKAVVISPVNTVQVGQVVPSDGSVTSAKIANSVTLTTPSLVGPVDLTSQDSSTADRVMTRDLVDLRSVFIDQYLWNFNVGDVLHAPSVGSGSATNGPGVTHTTGTTSGSSCYTRLFISGGQPPYHHVGQGRYLNINWSRKTILSGVIYAPSVSSQGIVRIFLGELFSSTTLRDPVNKAIGIKITNGNQISLMVYGATGLEVSSQVGTLANAAQFFRIESENGTVKLYLNETLVVTTTNGPTGSCASSYTALVMQTENGAVPQNQEVIFAQAKVWLI